VQKFLIFRFLRNPHISFYNGCTNLHSLQQYIRIPVLPCPCQDFLLLLLLTMAILIGVRWNLSRVLIFISFIIKEVKLFFVYLLAILLLPLRIPYLIHVPISSLGCWIFGGWVFWALCRFWTLVPYRMAKDFLPSCGLSLESRNFLFLCRSSLVWCSPFCSFFLLDADPFEFYLGSLSLYLSAPVYFLPIPGVVSKFHTLY
jgi:hypothetical protein